MTRQKHLYSILRGFAKGIMWQNVRFMIFDIVKKPGS